MPVDRSFGFRFTFYRSRIRHVSGSETRTRGTAEHHFDFDRRPGLESDVGIHGDGPPHFINNEDPKLTKSITTRAIDFMQQQQQNAKPYYVQVSYYAQHLSVVTRQKILPKTRQRTLRIAATRRPGRR